MSREDMNRACVKAPLPAYADVYPLHDYEPVGRERASWSGCCRQSVNRRLVMVRESRQTSINDFRRQEQLSHLNIARAITLYFVGSEVHVAHEYVELNVIEFPSLSLFLSEVASITSQAAAPKFAWSMTL